MDGVLVSRVDMAGDDDHTRFKDALCELTSGVWTQKEGVQGHGMPSVKVRSAREAPALAAERNVVKGRNESRLSSSLSLKESAVVEKPEERKRVRKGGKSRYENVQCDGSTKARCREPDGVLHFARTVESSADSDSPSGTGAHTTYSIENVLIAVIQMRSPAM